MNLTRLWAITRKEFLHVLRDPRSLGMALAMPMLMLTLFGYALTLDVDNVPLVVWDQSRTPVSRELIAAFTGSRYFSLVGYEDGYETIEYAIDSGQALAALVIPRDFADNIELLRPAHVQLIVDGSDSNTATYALGYVDSIAAQFTYNVVFDQVRQLTGRTIKQPVEFRPRVWFNPSLESKNYIVPGLIAVIMMIITALITSLTVAREWEKGTMEQLIATPVKGSELIFGKLIPYFVICMIDMLLSVIMGKFLFGVPMRGSGVLLFASAAIFLTGALSIGILVSIIARNQLVASQLALVLTLMPAYLLSGFIYPISSMPHAVQVVTFAVPARYFVSILTGIYLKGLGLRALWFELLFLTVLGIALLLWANLEFKKRFD